MSVHLFYFFTFMSLIRKTNYIFKTNKTFSKYDSNETHNTINLEFLNYTCFRLVVLLIIKNNFLVVVNKIYQIK